ncbi:reticulon-4a isoform X2 [Leucoraja erinacea]|uniref:reticulon-4a isoform X2 n=1 Tax=Leucoraja erinaceus TaxID=7782 RepID=UPI002454C5CD|nr:reticulon-4a isoform X2 [Leucoraja erinacea]
MSEEFQSPSVSSSARLDDIMEDSTREGAEKAAAAADSPPLKPGAGDAPVFPPTTPPPVPAPRTFEPADSYGGSSDESPPPLPARSRPEPDSTSVPAAPSEMARTRPESMDEPFFSPSVTPECVIQPADFSINLKDQPSSGEPVSPQDAAAVHVEPVPVFSISSFSSDSVTELTMSAQAVHADDVMQTEVPANTILPSISGFVENTVDRQAADNLEMADTHAQEAQVKPAIRKASELDTLISVDECSVQYNEQQCVESNESELKRTISLLEKTMNEQDTVDKEGLVINNKNTTIEKIELANKRDDELGPHLDLIYEKKAGALPLNRIVEENESMHGIFGFKEQTKPTDSGLNFCYGHPLEIKERNELNSRTAATNDANKASTNVPAMSESAVLQDHNFLDILHGTEKKTIAKGNVKLDYTDVDSLLELSEQDGKLSPTETYFALSQISVEDEPQTCISYAAFDSSDMLMSSQSDHFSHEIISAYDATSRGKTEWKETSKLPLPSTVLESEVTTKDEDEAKPLSPIDSRNKLVSKLDATSASEMNSQINCGLAVVPDQLIKTDILAEDMTSEQTAQNFVLDQSQAISQIELCEVAVGVETSEDFFTIETTQSTPEVLKPFEPLLSTLEQCTIGISEEVQGLSDQPVKTPSRTDTGDVEVITDPRYVKVQSLAQNESKVHPVYASMYDAASSTPEVTKIQHLFEDQKIVQNSVSEDPVVGLEQIPILQESNLSQHLFSTNKESVIKDEDLYKRSGYKESNISQSTNKSINDSIKQELILSKFEEETCTPTSLTPKQVSANAYVTVKRQDVALCNEIISIKFEPIMEALGDLTEGMKPFEKMMTDYKQCSLKTPSLQDQIETPMLIKNVTQDDLAGSVKVTDKIMLEIMPSLQEASGELLSSLHMKEKCAESIHSLIEDINTTVPPSVFSADLLTVDKGHPLQTSAEETCLNISQPVTSPLAFSQDKFPEGWENLSEMNIKTGHSEILEDAQGEMMPVASFALNEEVAKASKEVVSKILETSVALTEVLGEKEGTRPMCVPQQEAEIAFIVEDDDIRKKSIPVALLMPDLTIGARNTGIPGDSADAVIADISVKQDKNSVVDLIYWRDIKKTGLVFGASLFLLLSMTIFSIVSVIAYLGLAVLSVTISFRIYRGILQAVQKSDDGHPFKACLEKDVAVSDELVHKYSDIGLGHVNHVITELRRLFLVQDLVDSLKFSVLMWLLTYVGALFNGLTLLIIALVAVFSIPVVYERHQAQIDHYLGIVSKQIRDVTAKIRAKVPGLRKKTE